MNSGIYQRVFAAIDGGATRSKVMETAIRSAEANHAHLCFGYVVDAMPTEASGTDLAEMAESVRGRLEEELAPMLQVARENPLIRTMSLSVAAGPVSETLTKKLIANYEPDLVICCRRGLSKVHYAIVGSVSRDIIHTVRCDVLVLNP